MVTFGLPDHVLDRADPVSTKHIKTAMHCPIRYLQCSPDLTLRKSLFAQTPTLEARGTAMFRKGEQWLQFDLLEQAPHEQIKSNCVI